MPHIQRTVGLGADGPRWDSSRRCLVGDWPFAALCVHTSRDLLPQPKAEDGEAAAFAVKWCFLWLELVSITCPAGSKSQARPHRMSPNSADTLWLLGRALCSGCPRTVSLGERGPVSLLMLQLKGVILQAHTGAFSLLW